MCTYYSANEIPSLQHPVKYKLAVIISRRRVTLLPTYELELELELGLLAQISAELSSQLVFSLAFATIRKSLT